MSGSPSALALRTLAWLPPMAVAWWAVVEARPGSWGVGSVVVLAAAGLAASVMPTPSRWVRVGPLLAFAGWFLAQSLKGGWDVARRALAPSLPIAPGFVTLRTTLPAGAPRVLFADTVSLLPGTLTVDVVDDAVLVHGLDTGPSLEADARELERRIAGLFGLAPPGPGARA